MFAAAFSTPLINHPTPVQSLADGVRLAVRTRLEVIDPYLGHMSENCRAPKAIGRERNRLFKSPAIGQRLIQALDAIFQEAIAHGLRPHEPALRLFSNPVQQRQYEDIRHDGIEVWKDLQKAARHEAESGTGDYSETEKLLLELLEITDDYLRMALPQLEAKLMQTDVPEAKAS
jgi:hypothetical protein